MDEMDILRRDMKIWLKVNGHDYAWLARQCYVSESTVRNWMARKPIPSAKIYIMRDLVCQVPMVLPAPFVEVSKNTVISLRLDSALCARLEELAFSRGLTLDELIESEIRKLTSEA